MIKKNHRRAQIGEQAANGRRSRRRAGPAVAEERAGAADLGGGEPGRNGPGGDGRG